MNKKISQFEVTTSFEDNDILTLVQDKTNKIIHKDDFETSLSNTFATNARVDDVEEAVDNLNTDLDAAYVDLSNKIVEGDNSVTNNLTSNINSYYDVLNNKIITLDDKHDRDLAEVNDTVQGWIDDIDNRSTLQQLQDALNRLTTTENLVTELAELIANGEGGGEGSAPGFHTQPTSTIFPLTGYFKGPDASPLNTTDTLNQALSKLENQIEAVSSSSGSLPVIKTGENTVPSDRTIYTSGKVREDYLRKDGDTATGYTTFLQGIQGGKQFRSGWDGVGASLFPIGSKWKLELDDLFVRGNMTVNQLTVNEIKAVGGDILVTVADMKCTEVEEISDGWKCYFDDEDGTKYNSFVTNDLAICQKFDGKNVKRYWRKVNAVGSNYIVLSKDICEPGSSYPEAEDNILQLGHMYESDPDYNLQMDERRNAIFISAKGEGAPRISFYKNIDTFSLADEDGVVRERVVIGGNTTKFVGNIYQTSDTGIVRVPVYRGQWIEGNTYYYYDQVTYNGELWICMNPNGSTVKPSDTDDDWQKVVEKGEPGKPGSDVGKQVEIRGNHLFLYDSPDYSGIPDPARLNLTCTTRGLTNPQYEWLLMTETPVFLGSTDAIDLYYDLIPNVRSSIVRCNVTDSDGEKFYDDVEIGKIANGAEGMDAYWVELSNYSATVPYYSDGISKVELNSITTNVTVYKGLTLVDISNVVVSTATGSASAIATKIDEKTWRITLDSLNSASASFDLAVTLADGITVNKTWYINNTADGTNGFDGVDATYVYMSGEQYFHYKSGETVPTPTQIVLKADAFGFTSPSYQWYWSIAGAYDWQLIENAVESQYTVTYNGIYFTSSGQDEITFKCVVTTEDGIPYEDFMTINNIRDGENVYRATLQNEAATVPATSAGVVTDYSNATSTTRLKYGNAEVTDYSLRSVLINGTGTLTIDNSNKTIACTSLTSVGVRWQIDFYSPANSDTIVDSVDFCVTRADKGSDGDSGLQQVSIYRNTNSTPSRPTYTTLPASGSTWSLDPVSSTTTLTWVSTGYYNTDTNTVETLPNNSSYRWTTPVIFSPLNGAPGAAGISVTNVATQYRYSTSATSLSGSYSWSNSQLGKSNGLYIWTRIAVTYSDGSTSYTNAACTQGEAGEIGINYRFRGDYDRYKTYYWQYDTSRNLNIRDVVKNGSTYYMVNENRKGSSVSGSFNSDYWSAFGSSWESVATGLLFAEKADIAGWSFYNNYIASQANTVRLDGRQSPSSNIHIAAGSGAASSPGSAPFRVATDGSVYASNANITGNSRLGNFTISNGWLKCENASAASDTGYISLKSANSRIRFGRDLVPATAAGNYTLTAEIYNSNNGSQDPYYYSQNVALDVSSAGQAGRKTAINAAGFIKNVGGISYLTANFTNGGTAIGTGGHNQTFPYSLLTYENEFVFQLNSSGPDIVELPSASDMSKAFGQYPGTMGNSVEDSYIYHMTLTNLRYSNLSLFVRGKSGAKLYNEKGAIHYESNYQYGEAVVPRGSSIRLTYFNRSWYISGGYGHTGR